MLEVRNFLINDDFYVCLKRWCFSCKHFTEFVVYSIQIMIVIGKSRFERIRILDKPSGGERFLPRTGKVVHNF